MSSIDELMSRGFLPVGIVYMDEDIINVPIEDYDTYLREYKEIEKLDLSILKVIMAYKFTNVDKCCICETPIGRVKNLPYAKQGLYDSIRVCVCSLCGCPYIIDPEFVENNDLRTVLMIEVSGILPIIDTNSISILKILYDRGGKKSIHNFLRDKECSE